MCLICRAHCLPPFWNGFLAATVLFGLAFAAREWRHAEQLYEARLTVKASDKYLQNERWQGELISPVWPQPPTK